MNWMLDLDLAVSMGTDTLSDGTPYYRGCIPVPERDENHRQIKSQWRFSRCAETDTLVFNC